MYYIIYRLFLKTDLIVGGGWSYKIYQAFSINHFVFAELIFFIIFIITAVIFFIYFETIKKDVINLILISFIISYGLFITVIFQEYYDPLIFFIAVFFFEKNTISKLNYKNSIFLFFYFFTFYLGTFAHRYLLF